MEFLNKEEKEIFPGMSLNQKINLLNMELKYHQKKISLLERVVSKLMNELGYIREGTDEEFMLKKEK